MLTGVLLNNTRLNDVKEAPPAVTPLSSAGKNNHILLTTKSLLKIGFDLIDPRRHASFRNQDPMAPGVPLGYNRIRISAIEMGGPVEK